MIGGMMRALTFRAADVHLPGNATHLNKGQSSSEFSWFAEAL